MAFSVSGESIDLLMERADGAVRGEESRQRDISFRRDRHNQGGRHSVQLLPELTATSAPSQGGGIALAYRSLNAHHLTLPL
jgi:hypothetical protein